jgi:DNA polymerase-3 subunit epsilon
MNWLINFVSWITGLFILLMSFGSSLSNDMSGVNSIISVITMVGLALLMIPPSREWFLDNAGISPHRGLLLLLFFMAIFPVLPSTESYEVDLEYERELSAYKQTLLAELKAIPTTKYRENLIRYEALADLSPSNQKYIDKVAFYASKIEEFTGQTDVPTLQPNLPKKPTQPKPPLGVISALFLAMFLWVFMKLMSHDRNSHIKDKVVQDTTEVDLQDDESPEADVVTDTKPANEQEVDGFALPEEFIVFDLETTGLSPHDCEIIEIGAIKVNRDSGEHITFQALVKPSILIPSKITHITGITQKMINKDGEDIKAVIPEFLDFIGDLRLVAYNARFDMGFINAAVAKQGLKIKNPHSCALKMARRAWPDLESYKLVDVAERGGLSAKGNHRALKDAELTMTVYAAAAETLESLS